MNPIKTLLCQDTNSVRSSVLVDVTPMTQVHANEWHTHVQPLIDRYYEFDGPAVLEEDTRADVGWDWNLYRSLAYVHNAGVQLKGSYSGKAMALAIVVRTHQNHEIPIGMLTVVPEFYCNVANVTQTRGFAWFLADAPEEFYTQVLNVAPISGVARMLLDTAIQTTLDAKADGSLLLHADPHGGAKLVRFYTKYGMAPLRLGHPPVSILRRRNISEYFYMDSVQSAAFCAMNDPCR